jgi:ferrous iron transport protein A
MVRIVPRGALDEARRERRSRGGEAPVEQGTLLTLHDLPRGREAVIAAVRDLSAGDVVARRLRELGFVPGEAVRLVARGPIGRDPLAVQIGHTRFALRRAEASRVLVMVEDDQ